MSRIVVEQEAAENQNESLRKDLLFYLSESPAAEGFDIRFELSEVQGYYSVEIIAESDHKVRPRISFALDRIPVIKEYLRSTGALKVAFDEFLQEQADTLKLVREQLLVDRLIATQRVDVSVTRAPSK